MSEVPLKGLGYQRPSCTRHTAGYKGVFKDAIQNLSPSESHIFKTVFVRCSPPFRDHVRKKLPMSLRYLPTVGSMHTPILGYSRNAFVVLCGHADY